jgi:cytidyltransferase-like protein
VTGLFGGAFDPPHNGHLALVETALDHFDLERLLVLVVVDPGHRSVELDFGSRFDLARLAFSGLPRTEVVPEEHAYTVDALADHRFGDSRAPTASSSSTSRPCLSPRVTSANALRGESRSTASSRKPSPARSRHMVSTADAATLIPSEQETPAS